MNKIAIVSLLSLLSITGCGLVNVKTGFNTETKCLENIPNTTQCMKDSNGLTPGGEFYVAKQERMKEAEKWLEEQSIQRAKQERLREQERAAVIQQRKDEQAAEKAAREQEAIDRAFLRKKVETDFQECQEWAIQNCWSTTENWVEGKRLYVDGSPTNITWNEQRSWSDSHCKGEATRPSGCEVTSGTASSQCVMVEVSAGDERKHGEACRKTAAEKAQEAQEEKQNEKKMKEMGF